MPDSFELKFDPKTIEHLGVRMYSTLPPALAELISNAYDADASKVVIQFHELGSREKSITVIDNGYGMTSDDIQNKFLVIGRNRRQSDGDKPSPTYKRLPTGKKGLGKLALFGLAERITVDTTTNKLRNRFSLNWNDLLSAEGTYNPVTEKVDEFYDLKGSGTFIKLERLKRKTPFNIEAIADSLSKIFIVDENFKIILKTTNGKSVVVSNERRYQNFDVEFQWDLNDVLPDNSVYKDKISGKLLTSKTPIPPNSGLRGITIFSRGKLVNLPDFFSSSTSSHFYQYLTGWIIADFIDLLPEDVISTNRQYLNWDNEEMIQFRDVLSTAVSFVGNDWRKKRRDKKDDSIKEKTGVDREKWLATLPQEVRNKVDKIVKTLEDEEGISDNFGVVMQSLHALVPEYPMLHWRHLHPKVKERIKTYYANEQYAFAADQGVKIYAEIVRERSGSSEDGSNLANVFNVDKSQIQVADLTTDTGRNIQMGQMHLTRGLMQGFRNPINHAPIDSVCPSTFSELDCLNILSLVSYLSTRIDSED